MTGLLTLGREEGRPPCDARLSPGLSRNGTGGDVPGRQVGGPCARTTCTSWPVARECYTPASPTISRGACVSTSAASPPGSRAGTMSRDWSIFEEFGHVRDAIAREKQLKDWVRVRKMRLIEQKNPTWEDLADSWFGVRRMN